RSRPEPAVCVGEVSQALPQGRLITMLTLALASAGGLVFEITLTRIFSLYFQYHFAFLAVSLAVFGLSLGPTWEYRSRPRRDSGKAPGSNTLVTLTGWISLTLLIAAAGIAWFPYATTILPQTVLGILPFVLLGRLMAHIFAADSAFSGRLYGADL